MKHVPFAMPWAYALLIGALFLFPSCEDDDTDPTRHSITSFTPTEGVIGTRVTIVGKVFGWDKSQIKVRFGDIDATSSEIESVKDTEIKVAVPAGLGTHTGKVKINVVKGAATATSSGDFTILVSGTHTITSFTPTFGKAGTEVTITGTQFGEDKSKIAVSFGNVEAKAGDIKSLKDTEIKVAVPTGANQVGNFRITIKVDGKAAVSKTDFSILESKVAGLSLHLLKNNNTYANPQLKENSVQPATGSPAASGSYTLPANVLLDYSGHTHTTTSYRGAVDPSEATPWYAESNWSYYSYLVSGTKEKNRHKPSESQVVTDTWLRTQMGANKAMTLTANKYYILDGHVFVQDGEVLTIEAGTIIGGKQRNVANNQTEGALIIAKGGKIMANGTAAKPIIFTYDGDPLDGTTPKTTQGRWGGVILLGKADINSATESKNIEGIDTNEKRASYGGDNDADNSGTMTYVSIRHGGSEIGSGNEINGLTLGGVGHGTTLHHIEIIANKDDGIEFFGGTVGVRYLIVGYCRDDAFDYDQGYRGLNQFVILHLNDGGASERALECDGDDDAGGTPFALPLIANLTAIGGSSGRVGGEAMIQKANSGVRIINSLFKSFKTGLKVEFTGDGKQDAWKRFQDGHISLHNNLFYDFDGVSGLKDLFSLSVPK